MPKTKLQMLLRGQNLVGYRHYADDVVDEFVKRAVSNGIDIIRIFDALNDPRNLARAMAATKKEGAHVQGCISYTNSPVHSITHFAELAATLRDMGADSICIKDMAGIIYPYGASELVRAIKDKTGLPVQMHCHYTSGMASMAYLKAVEAGADVLDCANSALALSSSQPCEETMIASFQGTPYDTGLNLTKLVPIAEELKAIRKKYAAFDNADPRVDPNVLQYQIPGGMISNFISQLEQSNAMNRLNEVLEEVPCVRQDMGYPPLVTPSSQIVGSQALLNVLQGERYKMATKETQNYFKGEYGAPPAPMNQDVKQKVVGNAETITCRPADLIPPMLAEAQREIGAWIDTPEDLLIYIMFPQVAKTFLENRMAGKTRVEYNMVGGETGKVNYCPI
jgi:oxaloacetate decarboxylase alpha subunit